MPVLPARPPIERVIDGAQLRSLAMSAPAALGEPRQQARFLCGLSSPALTRARLTRNPLYGALEEYRFAQVLAWCEAAGSHRTSGVSSNQTSKRSVP
jgi:ATP-dependent DNA helicase RecQ